MGATTGAVRGIAIMTACFAVACTAGDEGHGFMSADTDTGGPMSAGTSATSQASSSSSDGGSEAPKLDVLGMSGGDLPSCADVMAEITPGEATIALLLDQSGTMEQTLGGSGVVRWDAVFDALLDPDTGVVAGYESELQFGMTLYSNADVPAGCPDLTTVAPAYDNREAMATVYEMSAPLGDTPTGESLLAGGDVLAALDDGSSKGVILATDGEPDTCDCPNACAGASKGVAIEATQQLYDMGIRVFVIAVGDSITDLAHLQYLANVGVGKSSYYDDPGLDEWNDPWVMPVDPADPATLFTANDPQALEEAFDDLISAFVPCDFVIHGTIKDIEEACKRGSVTLDGMTLQCPIDWRVIDPTTLRLRGEACDALQDGEKHEVSATFPCDVIAEG